MTWGLVVVVVGGLIATEVLKRWRDKTSDTPVEKRRAARHYGYVLGIAVAAIALIWKHAGSDQSCRARCFSHGTDRARPRPGLRRGEAGPVSTARRLVTSIDLDPATGAEFDTDRRSSISALHELELTDGRRITLLDDRGWSGSGPSDIWAYQSLDDLVATARTVVGPDEPLGDMSSDDAAARHWSRLTEAARAQGASLEPGALMGLPHDVEVSPRIRGRLAP